MSRSILHLNPDDFYASVMRVQDPTLRGKALLIAPPFPRSRILSASYEARKEGVLQGQRIEEAKRLCPRALWIPPQEGLFKKVGWKILRFLSKKAPRVEPGDAGEAFLDVSGCRSIFGPPEDQAKSLSREVLEKFSLEVSVGLASNKLVSRGASSDAKRAGLLDVFAGYEASFLAPWPVGRLPGVSEGLARRFEERSVRTVSDLAGIPPDWLQTWLGPPGRTLAQRAQGQDSSPVSDLRTRRFLSFSRPFEPEILDRDLLAAHTAELAGDLGRALRRKILRAGRLSLTIRYADNRVTCGSSAHPEGLDDDPDLIRASLSLLQRTDAFRMRVRRLGIEGDRLQEGQVQGSFAWETIFTPTDLRARKLSQARDAIRARFKGDKVLYWGSAAALHKR